ncbi:MAG: hypothetical protein J5I93_10005 [Pirellulaceae bacterium]|nr:hypothetical protein [Pirellulaceae bacterium]
MIHYSCDRCKRVLDPEQELRYVVKLEIYAAMEPLECDEQEADRDHLTEIQEILERLEDGDDEAMADDIYQKRRYDLCAECYRQYIKNPIGREAPAHLGFSQN